VCVCVSVCVGDHVPRCNYALGDGRQSCCLWLVVYSLRVREMFNFSIG
jgi:hypothetical protein